MLPMATIRITPEILCLVAGIGEFKGAWRAPGTIAPDRLSAPLRVATAETICCRQRPGVVFDAATPLDTPRLMTELLGWFVKKRSAGRLPSRSGA